MIKYFVAGMAIMLSLSIGLVLYGVYLLYWGG